VKAPAHRGKALFWNFRMETINEFVAGEINGAKHVPHKQRY